MKNMQKTVLIIAGSDSIGGAGIQADIKTCCAFGTYAMTAITAVTAQNTMEITGIQDITPEMVEKQIEAVATDIQPDAIKIGMLANKDIVERVARCISRHKFRNVVVDPVLVASSGSSLSHDTRLTVEAMKSYLFPLATLITPNMPEARWITGEPEASQEDLANLIADTTHAHAVLLKGGHGTDAECRDYLVMDGNGNRQHFEFSAPRIQTENSHGTGCTLSSAIASCLAYGLPLQEAVSVSKKFISQALENGKNLGLGHGNGPLDFFTKGFDLSQPQHLKKLLKNE